MSLAKVIRPRARLVPDLIRGLIPVLILSLALCLAGPGAALAKAKAGQDPSWRINAEKLTSLEEGNVLEAHGRVVFGHEEEEITCEHLRYNKQTKNIEAWGDVVWHHEGDVLKAERLKINLDTKMGKAFNARVFVSANHFYMSGREIEKTGAKTYVIKDCTITTCDGTKPDWLVRTSTLKVTLDGYGHLWNPRFYAGPLPIFYFPYGLIPIKNKRESGLLAPVLISSSRDGFAFELPFYWAWADWGETTFYLHNSDERGQGLGVELNFMLGQKRDRGLFYFDFLHDNAAYEKYRLGENSTATEDRYWLRGIMRAERFLPWGLSLNLMLDYPSDPDFIREFDYWETGLPNLNRRYRNLFGQVLRDSTEERRLNRGLLSKSWSNQSASLEFRYQYDPEEGATDTLVQYLPHLNYTYSDTSIGNTNLYYNFSVDATHNYRVEGDRGQELDGIFNIYALFDVGPYLDLQPSLSGRATYWRVDHNEDEEPDGFEEWRYRYYWYAGLDLSTTIFRIYDVNGLKWKKIKHQISPSVSFTYVPEVDHDPAPDYSSRVSAQELIDYSLTTTLTAKETQGISGLTDLRDEMWRRRYLGALADWSTNSDKYAGTTDEELREEYERRLRLHKLDRSPQYGYREFLRLELRQKFDIREARLESSGEKRPFSNITADLTFQPTGRFSARAQAEYNLYDAEFARIAVYTDIYDNRGDYLGLQWRRTWDENSDLVTLHQLVANGRLKIAGPWTAGGQLIYDLAAKKPISETVSLSFQRQCWGLAASYYHSSDDSRIALVFSLFGLGEIYRYERNVGSKIE